MAPPTRRIRVAGRPFDLTQLPRTEMDAFADTELPSVHKRGLIRLSSGMTSWGRFEVLLHELLHAAEWNLSEEWVDQTAKDITSVFRKLLRIEWRKTAPFCARNQVSN